MGQIHKMKIGILGSRGIPNNYGGFEQFAEYLSEGLVNEGYKVVVYNPHNHIYQEKKWHGVHIIYKYNPEKKLGVLGQFIYDFLCIISIRKEKFDIIFQLGYTSSSLWGYLLPSNAVVVTNMDGLEWKRSKYSLYAQYFLKLAEKLAIKTSNYLVADSICIQEYLKKYDKPVVFIPYGAVPVEKFDEEVLQDYNLKANQYYIVIARIEPENNIDLILSAFVKSNTIKKIVIVGHTNRNKYGNYIQKKYLKFENIIFLGGIYDIHILNMLRHYAIIYFHGHSVGGTNPSLLEAMSSKVYIAAHNNEFNRAIVEDDGLYFSSEMDIVNIIKTEDLLFNKKMVENNFEKIKEQYNWQQIVKSYDNFFKNIMK